MSANTIDDAGSGLHPTTGADTVERLESEVRSYCRQWPVTFATASGATLVDTEGRTYLDFFAGAGALNYGHNHPALRRELVDYLAGDGILHSLDMATEAKIGFLEALDRHVLAPRGLDYRVQFPGPTGTNAIEAALKLARKVTGRTQVVCFTNAFHGMSLGALATTGSAAARAGAGIDLTGTVRLPYHGYLGHDHAGLELLERMLDDPSSGLDLPAAVVVETLQAEGGINVASGPWLQQLQRLCRAHDMLLIVDDIQVGCGRTGAFFSFEEAGLRPDLVCLSKSISGLGLPLSLVLIDPDLDRWAPGEHNGTFRGNNAAFVTGRAALELFWADDSLTRSVETLHRQAMAGLDDLARAHPEHLLAPRGRGLILGLECRDPALAATVTAAAFEHGLVMERAGARDQVLKLLPPLTISPEELDRGLGLLAAAVENGLSH